MPLFLTEEEHSQCSNNPTLIIQKADSFIKDIQRQLETVKAQADASSITAEQTCALLEQRYVTLTSEYGKLESQNAQLNGDIQKVVSELEGVKAEKHQMSVRDIGKDSEIELLKVQVSELLKAKRGVLDLVEKKNVEITEKDGTIKSFMEKIVNLTEHAADREARLHDNEAELARSQAAYSRILQEKELIERHNVWLNEELTAKVDDIFKLRRMHNDIETEMSAKLTNVERQFEECSCSLKWNRERVVELEAKLTSVQEELCSSKDMAAANEEHLFTELSTVTKLVELYKESSEEWSRKAGDLEGVIKALETHISQVESDYKQKLEKEISVRKEFEKEVAVLKEKIEKYETEIENNRKSNELSLLPLSNFVEETWRIRRENDGASDDNSALVPKIPSGVSGTALAASLLRDGWSLAKMYEKYQEAVDSLRHERLGRQQSQAILERVLYEIEQKAGIILDERAEHDKMLEAYSVMNEKLQQSLMEQADLEKNIQVLKAELRRHERDYDVARKEIVDLEKQVTVLVKECRDIQLRCGSSYQVHADDLTITSDTEMNTDSEVEKVISERLLTFKDINGLVEQNVQLRSVVRSLSDENEKKGSEIREAFEIELQKQIDEAASKVTAVLKRAEEQGNMIESLHTSVAMYKRLYEEEIKRRESYPHPSDVIPDTGRKDLMFMLEGSQEASRKVNEQASERAKYLEEELAKFRSEASSLRTERDRLAMETSFAQEKLDRFMKESERQREKIDGVLERNVEFSQLIIDYQKKLRDSADSLHAAQELSRKLDVEVSILKNEKEMLLSSEKRARDEVCSLSERVHRLQATIDTIQGVEEFRQETRAAEVKKKDEHIKQLENEWAQAKKELQEERDLARSLALDRESSFKDALKQVEELRKELADASQNIALTQTRAAVAEARFSDLDAMIKSAQIKDVPMNVGATCSTSEVMMDQKTKEEMEKLREESQANKNHMLQYKNIAHVNEIALKQMESAHESYKVEADKLKKSFEDEILSLRERISELESDYISKSNEVASNVVEKEEALGSVLVDIARLKEENAVKVSQIIGMEKQISSLKEELDNEHQRWRTSQTNYERQVMLQSESIQELTKTSQALGLLQDEVSELRKLSTVQKNEHEILMAKLEAEKLMLEQLKIEAEKKYCETDEQNKILHNRLEALHIKLAEKERYSAGISFDPNVLGEADLQPVVNHLRRSKEIAETEISLLRQEKMRLQSQLEHALKTSEKAQALLHSERAISRANVFADEEFKSLQIQIREINLLRESNTQLREENKYNFEECQKLREIAQKARVETEQLESQLREKQLEIDALQKEISMYIAEKENLENRVTELLEMCKNIDLEDYERMKVDCEQMQVKLTNIEVDLKEARKVISEKESLISTLKQDLENSKLELTDKENKLTESLVSKEALRLDHEKLKKQLPFHKRRAERISKEKEELSKENVSLSKQLEECRTLSVGGSTSEQAIKDMEKEKEKESKIQTLVSTLESLRRKAKEDIRTEKENHNQEKQKLLEENERLKRVMSTLPQDQCSTAPIDNQSVSTRNDGLGPHASNVGASFGRSPAIEAPAQALISHPSSGKRTVPSQSKAEEDKAKKSDAQTKPNTNTETRKVTRKLIRPKFTPKELSADTEMPEVDGSSVINEQQNQPTIRKRSASLPPSELREELGTQPDASNTISSLGSTTHKKPKGSDSRQENLIDEPPFLQENLGTVNTLKESLDADTPLVDDEKNAESTSKDLASAEPKETSELDVADEMNAILETEEGFDEGSKDTEDTEQPTLEIDSDKDDVDLAPEDVELEEDNNILALVTSPEVEEDLNTLAEIDGETTTNEIFDSASPKIMNDEKSDIGEENVDESDIVRDQGVEEGEIEQSPIPALESIGNASTSNPPYPIVSHESAEGREVLPTERPGKIINLGSQRRTSVLSPPRGRARSPFNRGSSVRGRIGRGRGQPPSND